MTIHESGTLLSECLADDGWTAVVDSDGGVISEYPPEQESSYSEALRRCLDEVGVGAPIDYSPEQYEALYESAVESQKCLDREFGLQTPEAPSLATFIEAQGAWSPFNQLPDMSAEDFLAIQQRCPQPTL
ncbi:MAG: hypothetical protein EOO27_28625 [Comamonadaceae bacterium]|nr:MAG: hypothetical protein EOO27_28625 [Comamonadaceae bacterium]